MLLSKDRKEEKLNLEELLNAVFGEKSFRSVHKIISYMQSFSCKIVFFAGFETKSHKQVCGVRFLLPHQNS